MVPVPPAPPTWHGMPPEVNTGRLMVGAGPAPMLQAAAGWEAMAVLLETQADELAAALANLTSVWSGAASERAVAATMPMVMWLRTTALQAQKRALQASAQASAYSVALATTPPIPEIEENHITNAVLNATNFFGVNTGAIAANETDYVVRMWNQAAGAMDAYQAETAVNLLFEPITPMTPIVMPGVGETTAAAALASTAPRAAEGALRNLVIEQVGATAMIESVGLITGRTAAQINQGEQRAVGAAQNAQNSGQQTQQSQQPAQQGLQQGMQMAMQMGSQAAQIPQQFAQMIQSPMQTLTQPLQQVTQMVSQFSSMGGGQDKGIQMGLMNAMPFSNHPLAGGSGPSSGAGLVRAASLPGLGGTTPRTSLLSGLLGTTEDVKIPAATGASSNATGGLAPVGAGGAGPMTGTAKEKKEGESTKQGLTAATPLTYDQSEDEDDDW